MAGAYCKFCDRRCFVYRELPDGSWSGHMATCTGGMAHDRKMTGYDHTTAINPYAKVTEVDDSHDPSDDAADAHEWEAALYDRDLDVADRWDDPDLDGPDLVYEAD